MAKMWRLKGGILHSLIFVACLSVLSVSSINPRSRSGPFAPDPVIIALA